MFRTGLAVASTAVIALSLGCSSDSGDDGGGGSGGGSAGTSSTAGSSGSADSAPRQFSASSPFCVTDVQIPQGGGWAVCDGQILHRFRDGVCTMDLPERDLTDDGSDASLLAPGACTLDIHCDARAQGYCENGACTYLCAQDSDCASGEICYCLDQACIPATCSTDVDCPDGSGCVASQQNAAGLNYQADCQSSTDECYVDSDCTEPQACLIGPGGRSCGLASQ